MCIIINKPADVDFSREWLADFWFSNRDGAGIMFHDGNRVVVRKITAPTCEEWIAFYEVHARGRDCAIHLRMRTHGDINEANTHPYTVGRGYYLMHNGVLSSGNAADRSKSDTWHFINDVLKPALKQDPKCLEDAEFRKQLGTRIGRNNKFVIMGTNGKLHTINRESGVVWNNAWFSNTYAWSAPKVGDYMIPVERARVVRTVKPVVRAAAKAVVEVARKATKAVKPVQEKLPFIHKAVVVNPTDDAQRHQAMRERASLQPTRIVTPRYLRPELWMPLDELKREGAKGGDQ